MSHRTDAAADAQKIVELKRLITTERFEKLEEAVDAFLWADEEDDPSMQFASRNAALPESRPEWVE
jgi:hypothetical protein